MSVRELRWSPPTVVDDQRLLYARTTEGLLLTAKGHWSNVDVYIVGPSVWGTSPARIRVYALQGTVRVLVNSASLDVTPFTSLGGGYRAWLACSVRGNVSDGWDVTGASLGAVNLGPAYIYAVCWGTESTPEQVSTSIQSPLTLTGAELRLPRRAAHLTYFDDVSSVHRLVVGDAFGRPKVIAIPEQLGSGEQGSSPASEAARVARNFGVKVRWLNMTNTIAATGNAVTDAAAVRYFQLFDSSSAPAALAVPKASFGVAPGASKDVNFGGQDGWQASSGCALGCSSTPTVYTAAADGFFSWILK